MELLQLEQGVCVTDLIDKIIEVSFRLTGEMLIPGSQRAATYTLMDFMLWGII